MDRKTFTEAYDKMRPDFAYREQGGVGIYTLPAFSARPEIDHGFSARIGGVSKAPFTGLNLSFTICALAPCSKTNEKMVDNCTTINC